ncbi:MAG: YkgJ family cysteine cluster protein [Candidatus Aerophobetes bacterium]|nr:YkgJ family cysteine cluster protein [Candidatus Aerophobetes bacterium]
MIIETDINEIRRIAKLKEDENWEFRSFLKGCDWGKIDVIVHKLYRNISSKIDCKTCGNCCKKVLPVLNQKDVEKLANGLKLSVDAFKDKYIVERENNEGITFNKKPCPFLNNNLCTQYKYRPEDCRSYPHLHKKDFSSRLINVIENTSICPIVFNVYEALKEEVWNNPEFDDFDDFDWD